VSPGLPETDRLGAIQLCDLAINPHADESFALGLFDDIPEFTWLVLDERGEHDDLRSGFVA
jgi:hypothetical protein